MRTDALLSTHMARGEAIFNSEYHDAPRRVARKPRNSSARYIDAARLRGGEGRRGEEGHASVYVHFPGVVDERARRVGGKKL